MGCGECMAKFGLITFNILFLLSGIAVLGVGIWVKVDQNVVNMVKLVEFDSDDTSLSTAAWVLIGFGGFVLIVSAFGFLAACCANKTRFFIVGYIFFLVIIFCGEFGGGITAAVFKKNVDKGLKEQLDKSLHSYEPGNNLIAKAWDYMQTWLHCCGSVLGPKDYANANFTKQDQHVPNSCCVLKNSNPEDPQPVNLKQCQLDAQTCQATSKCPKSTSVQTNGCYEAFEEEIKSHLALVIGVGVGIAMFQLLGIVMAVCICKRKGSDIV